MKKQITSVIVFLAIFIGNIYSQNENVIPIQVKEKFPEITLTSSNGELVNTPVEGRNTMLIFIRGKVLPNLWCPICHYQYFEMKEAIEKTKIAEKYEMDIYFIMPYKKDSLQNWINAIHTSLNSIDRWKNPENVDSLPQATIDWMEYSRLFFPKVYSYSPDNFRLDIPVMFDPDQKISNGLFLYQEEWGGTTVPQNVPTVFIIDKNGKTQFKYYSQYTNDRPDADYLIDFIEKNL